MEVVFTGGEVDFACAEANIVGVKSGVEEGAFGGADGAFAGGAVPAGEVDEYVCDAEDEEGAVGFAFGDAEFAGEV